MLKDRPQRPHVDNGDYVSGLRQDAAGQDSTNAHHVGVDESLEDVRRVAFSVHGISAKSQ